MSIRRIPHTSKRAFRPAYDDLEGRRLMSSFGATVNDSSAPAIAAFKDRIYIAYYNVVQQGPLRLQSASDNGKAFDNRIDLPAKSLTTPALAVFDGRLYLAWTGNNKAHDVNVASSSNGVNFGNMFTLPESSIDGPALTTFDGRLDIAWTGTNHQLNVESSSNGVNFGNKVTLPESSYAAPALTDFQERSGGTDLEIAWIGVDNVHHLNLESSSNGVNFGNKVTLPETNSAPKSGVQPAPALASFDARLYIACKGTDGRLNFESSADGVTFGRKSPYLQSTENTGPELADVGGSLDMAWTSDTNPHVVHQVTTIAGAKNA
jgi:hypothetical protein